MITLVTFVIAAAMAAVFLGLSHLAASRRSKTLVEHIRKNQHVGTFEIQMIDSPDSDLMP